MGNFLVFPQQLVNVLQGMSISAKNVKSLEIVYYRKTASCTHVSAILHTLSKMKQTFSLQLSDFVDSPDNNGKLSLP